MSFFTAILRFFATIFSPLFQGGGTKPVASDDDLAVVEAKARRKQVVAVVAVLVIIGSLISLYFSMVPSAPKINHAPFIGLGAALAEETATLLNDRGRIVVVLSPTYQVRGNPKSSVLESFKVTLKKHPGLATAGTEVITIDETQFEFGLTTKQFEDLVTKYASVDGLVFFTGLPSLNGQPAANLSAKRPKVIATQINTAPIKPYFTGGLADVMIIARTTPSEGHSPNPQTPREWFTKYYEVVTTKNFHSLQY